MMLDVRCSVHVVSVLLSFLVRLFSVLLYFFITLSDIFAAFAKYCNHFGHRDTIYDVMEFFNFTYLAVENKFNAT